ncbi:uncharacterized protein JCM6883_005688 [Sporobolomyces salmoneus]|uniref:uncharacterized protein n=1 Tax=Sporobolomyces salmoneus TaxID=183962 RepID=UPI003170D3DE
MKGATAYEIPPIPAPNSLKPAPASTRSIDFITSLLGSTIRLAVPSTSRQFIGIFVCIDPQGNLVLDQAREWKLDGNQEGNRSSLSEGRDVGLILIKRGIWGKMERLRTEDEKLRDEANQTGSCNPS